MKKKLLTAFCFVSVVFALAACGNPEDVKSTGTPSAPTTSVEPTDPTAPPDTPVPTQAPTATPLPTEVPEPTPIPPCNPHINNLEIIDSTCVELGQITYTCKVCGHVEVKELALSNNHKPGEWMIEQAATENSVGIAYQTCTLCEAKLNRTGYRLVDGQMQVFTWRETTMQKDLYWSEEELNSIGQIYLGEDFNEVVQMMDDPTITFKEEHFYDGTVFEGLTREHVRYLAENGYTVHQLVNEIVASKLYNVFDYFESIGKPLER